MTNIRNESFVQEWYYHAVTMYYYIYYYGLVGMAQFQDGGSNQRFHGDDIIARKQMLAPKSTSSSL